MPRAPARCWAAAFFTFACFEWERAKRQKSIVRRVLQFYKENTNERCRN